MTQKLVIAFDAPVTPGRPNGGVILWDEAEQAEIMEVRGRFPTRTVKETRVERDLRAQPGYEEAYLHFIEDGNTDPRTSAWFGVMAAEEPSDSARMMGLPVVTHKCADCAARHVCAVNKLVGDLGIALEVGLCSSYC